MEFKEKFKLYSTLELLRIVEYPEDFQPKAVEAAETLLSDRNLSEEEIKIAKDKLELEKLQKLEKYQKKKEFEGKVNKMGKTIFDNLNPIQKEKPTTNKTINIISLIFGGISLYSLVSEFSFIYSIYYGGMSTWDYIFILYFIPVTLLLISTILFYKRKQLGWILLTMYLSVFAVLALGYFLLTVNTELSGDSPLNHITPPTSPATFFLKFLFLAGTLWIISMEKIRTVYSVSITTMLLSILIPSIVVGYVLMMMFF